MTDKVKLGDNVKVIEGTFESFERTVQTVDETNGRVTVEITIFDRSHLVEVKIWQVEVI